jgi:hypothetical protein
MCGCDLIESSACALLNTSGYRVDKEWIKSVDKEDLPMTVSGSCMTFSLARGSALLALSTMLMACAGIESGKSPGKSFEVDIPVETAYERAIEQTKMCLVTVDRFPMTAEIAADKQTAFVRVNMSMTNTLLSDVRISAESTDRSRVRVQMWGVDVWDMTAVDAMQAAIEFGVPSCVNYFPTNTPKKKR